MNKLKEAWRHILNSLKGLREDKWHIRQKLDEHIKDRDAREKARKELKEDVEHYQHRLDTGQGVDEDLKHKIELHLEHIGKLHKVIHNFSQRIKDLRKNYKHLENSIRWFVARRTKVKRKIDALEQTPAPAPPTSGVGTIDGKTVAAWMIPWIEKSRAAGWQGTIVSGYRTPEYSTSLCMNMCGAPSCPGRCAGASSNHSGSVYPAGAIDVSYYWQFKSIQYQIGSPLRNNLPADPVHFSVSGS